MNVNNFDLLPGLRICFESPNYVIKPEYASGIVLRSETDITATPFTIMNSICRPDEVSTLFRTEEIVKRINDKTQYKGCVYFYHDRSGFQ